MIFQHYLVTTYPAKSEQKVHMYYEREKRGFDLMSEVCALLHLLSLMLSYGVLAPGDSAKAGSLPQNGMVFCT